MEMDRSGNKFGIIGGAFDPIHYGHLRSALEVCQGIGLDKIIFVPTYHPPHKDPSKLTPFEHRVRLINLAIEGLTCFSCSEIEKDLSTPSYSVNTLEALKKSLPEGACLYFLIGSDAFFELTTWKDYKRLFDLATLVVMVRMREGPEAVEAFAQEVFSEELSNGRIITFSVTQLEISSSKIRQLLREGKSPRFLLPQECIDYLEEHKIHMNVKAINTVNFEDNPRHVQDVEERLQLFLKELEESHGENIVALDVRGLSSICDFFIIAQGRSTRHVQGACERLRERLKKHKIYLKEVEGEREGKWILMDYGDIVIHLFYEPMREFYDLEGLWHEAKRIEIRSAS